MGISLSSSSEFIVKDHYNLHLRRFKIREGGPAVLLVHGLIENGRIFYAENGDKGLAPWLATQGLDVFVADLRGKGRSTPALARGHNYGQREAILEDIPAFVHKIKEIKPGSEIHAIGHSWGGVLLLSYLARFPHASFASMVFFGTKRTISVINPTRLFNIDLMWTGAAAGIKRLYGYLPAKKLGFGSDNEPFHFHRQTRKWIYGKWIDHQDGFNYKENINKRTVPPTLYLAAIKDTYLGHPADVKRLMAEVQGPEDQFVLLSKRTDHLHDYNHINMVTHPDAPKDHFEMVIEWIQNHSLENEVA